MIRTGRHWIGGVVGVVVVCLGFLISIDLHAQPGPYASQIQSALRSFLTQANTWTGAQTFGNITIGGTCTGCATTPPVTLAGGTVTSSTPVLTLTQTWNAVAVFDAATISVTDTSNNASVGSTYLRVKGNSNTRDVFQVRKVNSTEAAMVVCASSDTNCAAGLGFMRATNYLAGMTVGGATAAIGGSVLYADNGQASSTTGEIRFGHNSSIHGRNSANGADRNLLDWGVAATDTVRLGDGAVATQITGSTVTLKGGGTGAMQLGAGQTTAPTCTTNCGTPGNVCVGTDTSMICTMGTTPASGFVIAFNGTWAAAPSCQGMNYLAGMVTGKSPLTMATTTGQITVVTNGTAPATGDKYAIHCIGVQ